MGGRALSLNAGCEAIEHNEAACTQALSDDMPSMHRPNLQPLLPYEMHLLYVIVLFEAHTYAHTQWDFGKHFFLWSAHSDSSALVLMVLSGPYTQGGWKAPRLFFFFFKTTSNRFLSEMLYQILH